MLETNLDDITGELLSYTMERLLKEGAKDVFFTPIYMKKNRPATKLSILCEFDQIDVMEEIVFIETTALGIRRYPVDRTTLSYRKDKIECQYGTLDVKISEYKGNERTFVEYESAKRMAIENNIPIVQLYNLI